MRVAKLTRNRELVEVPFKCWSDQDMRFLDTEANTCASRAAFAQPDPCANYRGR